MRLRLILRSESCCDSLFVKTEERIFSNSKLQEEITKYLKMNDIEYRSLIDCLFVNLFPMYKEHCIQFYKDDEENLYDLLLKKNNTNELIEAYDIVISQIAMPLLLKGFSLKKVSIVVNKLVN